MTEDLQEKNKRLLEELKKKNKPEDAEGKGGEDANDEDDDQNFIRKDEPQEEKSEEKEGEEVGAEEVEKPQLGFFGKLKNKIFPKANQNRNLDDETGGLEAAEQKENTAKDAWDDRSEEVDKMGSTDVFNSTGMRSVVWKQKKARLDAKKIAEKAVNAHEHHAAKGEQQSSSIGLSSFDNQSFTQKLKNLRQDRTDAFGKDGGGLGR